MKIKSVSFFILAMSLSGAFLFPELLQAQTPSKVKSKKIRASASQSPAVKKLQGNLDKIESSIKVTKKKIEQQRDSQFSPDLYFVLAELLHDKATASAALKKEKNPGAPEAELDFSQEKTISAEAIEMYRLIEDRFPDYSNLDRVLFTSAIEYKGLNDEKNAMAYFKKVAEKFPKTLYGIKAQLELGNMFYDKKDYEFALAQYQKVLVNATEPELSKAHFKIGNCYIQLDKWMKSLQSFEKIYQPEKEKIDALAMDQTDSLREEALVASVWPLLELAPHEMVSKPIYQKPIEYYRKVAGDKARFRRVLARLAQRFEIKKRTQEAAEASLELFRLADTLAEKKSAFETGYMAFKKVKNVDFPFWILPEFETLVLWMRQPPIDGRMKADIGKYEEVYRDLLTSLNKTAMITKRSEDLLFIGKAYDAYLALYPSTKFTGVMKLNQAEVLFQGGDSARAGQVYFELAKNSQVQTKGGQKSIYDSSLESFLKSVTDPKAPQLDKLQARDGYREIAKLYEQTYRGDKKIPGIQFNVAKTYYDEQNFDAAAKSMLNFLRAHPNHENSQAAALLYLDCFYLRRQLKEMVVAGRQVMAIRGISSATIAAVKDASNQAQLKALRSVAGDFSSKDYALKFREFARKNKNSQLGEQAMYEAFTSLRAQNQEQAFEVGEEYVGTYPKTARGKEVLLSLSQLALVLLDYNRAASYMASYAQNFPDDSNSKSFSAQAATIYEYLGKLKEATVAYQMAGQNSSALKALFKYGDWASLNKLAASEQGISGQYYQGISLLRQGQEPAGLALLNRVASSSGSSQDEKEMVGHAAIIVAEKNLAKFRAGVTGQRFSPALLQQKASEYQTVSNLLQNAVNSGGGRWVVGGLYNLYVLNAAFAQFLQSAQPPAGMSAAQLKQLVAGQVQSYQKTAKDNQASCLKIAEENVIPSSYVEGCRKGAGVGERTELALWPKPQSRGIASVGNFSQEFKANPRSGPLLRKMAVAQIRGGQFNQALLFLSRASELEPNESLNDSFTGIAYLHMKQYAYAQAAFQQALEKNSKDGVAHAGLAGMAKAFGFTAESRKHQASASAKGDAARLHPWLN